MTERIAVVLDPKDQGTDAMFRKVGTSAKKAGKDVAGVGDITAKSASKGAGALKSLLVPAAIAGGVALLAFGKKGITAASDLAESTSKAGVVFGQSTDKVLAFGDGAAKALGQSKRQAVEAAGTFGNLFVSMGIGQEKAADLSTSIVTLASDLASFNNSSPEEALEALRSGLVGETEPLRRFGVNLNAAAIEQEALNQGLAKSKDELTPAAKAQAAYSLILKQTTTAQGDFARTAGGQANQQRILAAQAEDLAATFGKILLPAATGVTSALNKMVAPLGDVVEQMGGLPGPVKAGAIGLLSVAAASKVAAVAVPKVADGIDSLVTSLKGVKLGAVVAGGALGVLGIAAGVLVDRLERGKKETKSFFDALDKAAGADTTEKKIRVKIAALQDESEANKLSSQDRFRAIEEIRRLQGVLDEEARAQSVVTDARKTGAIEQKTAAGATKDAADAVDEFGRKVAASTTHENEFGETVSNTTGRIKEQKTAAERLTFALDKLNGKNITLTEATADFANSLEDLKESVKENGKSMDTSTQKGRDLQDSFIASVKSAQALSVAVGDTSGYEAGRQAAEKSRTKLREFGLSLGLSRKEVDRLIASIFKVPPVKKTDMQVKAEQALARAEAVRVALSKVKDKRVTVYVTQSGSLARITRDLEYVRGFGTIPVNIRVNGRIIAASKGGEVKGGTPGRDSVPILAMPGERVLTVAENRAYKLRLPPSGGSGGTAAGPTFVFPAGTSGLDRLFMSWLQEKIRHSGGTARVVA